jgi:hypothetical protein
MLFDGHAVNLAIPSIIGEHIYKTVVLPSLPYYLLVAREAKVRNITLLYIVTCRNRACYLLLALIY